MKKLMTVLTIFLIGGTSLLAQNEFEITEGIKGVFVPRLSQSEICNIPISGADDGLLVFNTGTHTFMYVCGGCDPDGIQWMEIQANYPGICVPSALTADRPSANNSDRDRIEELEKQIAKLSQQVKEMNKE